MLLMYLAVSLATRNLTCHRRCSRQIMHHLRRAAWMPYHVQHRNDLLTWLPFSCPSRSSSPLPGSTVLHTSRTLSDSPSPSATSAC